MSMITIRNLQFQYDAAPEINALYGIDLVKESALF